MKPNDITIHLRRFSQIITHILSVKSPHTALHIGRVPQLAMMIATEVYREKKHRLTHEENKKIELAAQLHDCGKTTIPDYLLEKSTKLETPYNRIHEIRDRFEILYRDAQIAYYQEIIRNPNSKAVATQNLKETLKNLEQDFAFIANCNIGNTSINRNDIKRLKTIGKQKFKRYFNRLLGLSWVEKKRLSTQQIKKYQNPAWEFLLQDNPEDKNKNIPTGEIYNLSTLKGTINDEERKIIEQHALQTENILTLLNIPAEYADIIKYAAEHHERLNGEGYPRGLTKKDLSLNSRIIMIADIFEALTSADRPYKTPKTISEALRILQTMKNKQQIDAEIYKIFLQKKIFMTYAQQYLSPQQIDNIDINDFL